MNAAGEPLPNGMDGIRISQGPERTVIGGTPEEGNLIAHNGGCGVYISNDNCRYHLISCNRFHDNGSLAIDLFEPGVNANDAGDTDDGANGRLNYPVLTSVTWTGARLHVEGTLDVANPQTCEVQLYRAEPDPTGHGEGRDYLASVTPSADGSWSADLDGTAATDYLTALTIDGERNTSEFSRCRGTAGPVSINEITVERIEVRPNPAREAVHIRCPLPYTEVRVYDMAGETVLVARGGMDVLNISRLAPGIYLLQVWNGDNLVGVGKVVKE